jgi:hypothetical protein
MDSVTAIAADFTKLFIEGNPVDIGLPYCDRVL